MARNNNRKGRAPKGKAQKQKQQQKQRKRSTRPQRRAGRKRAIFGPIGSALGTAAGAALGGPAGAGIGGALGSGLGTIFGAVTGLGDYQIVSNSLFPGAVRNPNPHPNSTLVDHREYLMDVVSSPTIGAFSSVEIPINPGLPTSFPFLSQIAANFEEYAIEGMFFQYVTTSGNSVASTNTALGTVIIASKYNSYSTFGSKAEMESSSFCNSTVPSNNMPHFIECDPKQSVAGELYIRTGAVPYGQDRRFYDLAVTTVATTGLQAANVVLGELWVSYQVALLKPRLYASLGNFSSWLQYVGTTPLTVAPLGSAGVVQGTSTPALPTTSTVFTFPISPVLRTYIINVLWQGNTAGSFVAPTMTYSALGSAAAPQVIVLSNVGEVFGPSNSVAVTTKTIIYKAIVRIAAASSNASASQLTIGTGGVYPTSSSFVELTLFDVPNNIG